MDLMKRDIQRLLERVLEDMGLEEAVSPQVSVPENPLHGDFSTNIAMLLSKQLKKNPREIAEELKSSIQKYQTTSGAGIIDRVEIAGPGFINLFLTEASLISQVSEVPKKGNAYGSVTKIHSATVSREETGSISAVKKLKKGSGASLDELDEFSGLKMPEKPVKISRKNAVDKRVARQNKKNDASGHPELIPEQSKKRIMIEFADPNPFKEIHIGHVRNIALGESFCRLMESQGNDVRRANYEGDVGLHVAKSLWGLTRLSKDGVDISGVGLDVRKKAALLGRAYAVGSKAFENDTSSKDDIIALNTKIYASDEAIIPEWRRGRQWSLDYFDTIYARLGTHFDRYYFESEVAPLGVTIVEKHISDNVFEKSQGAIVYRGEKVGLHTRVFVTKERYATYEAKDLALAPLKYSEWKYDLSIIMTGNEQTEYFKVMLAALAQINPDLASRTRHMPFGMVRLTTGKMSSRTGDVITADWLIEEAKKKIYGILSKNASNYSEVQKSDIAEKAAIAAIKYSMLRVNASSDIAFDLEASVSFEGDSGPYLQYTYARCKSVLRKAKTGSLSGTEEKLNENERMLARTITQFPDVVSEAAENFAPNSLCTYLFRLAQEFNLFYAHNPILGDTKRLALTSATAQVLKNGLYLLGIDVLEQM